MSVKLRKTRIGDATAEIVRLKHKRDPDGTDGQILQAIRDLKKRGQRINEYQVLMYCSRNMYGKWSIGKVEKAVNRLETRGKITTSSTIEGGRACRVLKLVP